MVAYRKVRIGLFSDYYLAQNDGTAIAVEISRAALVSLAHKVYVFCPRLKKITKPSVVTFRSMPGALYPGVRITWPFTQRALAQVAAQRLDIFHIQTPLFVGLFGLWAAKKLDKPVVMSAHLDMDFMGEYAVAPFALAFCGFLVAIICHQPKRFLKVLFSHRPHRATSRRKSFAWRTYAFLSDQCDLTIAISQKIYDELKMYKQRDNLVLIPNGINFAAKTLPKPSVSRRRLGYKPDDFIIITSNRLVREKRTEEIIYGFAQLAKKQPRAKLIVLNDGPQMRKLVRLAEQLGVKASVNFAGFVLADNVSQYIAAADVFVNASLREVASLAVLEAAELAKPLILFDERLIEPLKDGQNGFFVKTPAQLAAKIEQLSKDPKLVQKMGVASRQRVRKKFSVDNQAKMIEAAYTRLIKRV